MIIIIRRVENGYILTVNSDETGTQFVFNYTVEGFQELLYSVVESMGPGTSRWSEKRIKISIEPGDKFEIE